jgi:hypothetical protein
VCGALTRPQGSWRYTYCSPNECERAIRVCHDHFCHRMQVGEAVGLSNGSPTHLIALPGSELAGRATCTLRALSSICHVAYEQERPAARCRSGAYGCPKTELESGTLLAELEQRFAYGLDDVARRFDRSVSRVSR